MDIRFLLLQLCFFVSGFAALLYETVWTREFAFVFGTSELAVSAVLAAYMAGLALGAAIAARLTPRLTRPVLAYGLLELGIAVAALLVPFGIRLLMGIYVGWLGGLHAPPETLGLATALFHLAGAFIVLLPCTVLMGATLPLLARHAVRSDEEIGPRIGLLYGVNTAGAISGALVAAFVLLPDLGLRSTVYVGAAANFVVFVAAILLARSVPANVLQPAPALADPRIQRGWILMLIAISGAISFVYEVLWARMLGYLLGGSATAFATMLASFLLGIALGSTLASRLARRREAAAIGFVVAQLAIALASWGAFTLADRLPRMATALGASPENLAPGALTAVLTLLPFTLCIGATFPFAVRLFAEDADNAGPASARVYSWNTAGSIVGAVLAGFFLLPTLGFAGTLVLGVLGNLALAAAATFLFLRPERRLRPMLLAGGLLLVLVVATPGTPTQLLSLSVLSGRPLPGQLSYLGVGRSATVALFDTGRDWRLVSNGLPESAINRPEVPRDRLKVARWLGLLPALVRPDIQDMLMIGLGGGATLGAVTPGLSKIDLIELEPEVVMANRLVADGRRDGDPLADPRVTLHMGDARGALMLADSRYVHYDAIVSQPSHPWTSGASHLYTLEFFEMIRARLRSDGVFVQWIGLAFTNADLVRGLLATLRAVFPYVEVYQPADAALLFAASREPFDTVSNANRVIEAAPIQFGRTGVHSVEDVALVQVLDNKGTTALASGAVPFTDDHNRLAFSVGRLANRRERMAELKGLLGAHDPLPQRIGELDVAKIMRRLGMMGAIPRAERLLGVLSAAERSAARGWVQYERGRSRRAEKSFRAAVAADPLAGSGQLGLACLQLRDESAAPLSPRASAIAEGLAMQLAQNWQGLQRLDGELAKWGPADLLFPEAARLRAAWRIESGRREAGDQALQIIDVLLSRHGNWTDYLARAEAAHLAGKPVHAWIALERVGEALHRQPLPELASRAYNIARQLETGPRWEATLKMLERVASGG